MSAVRGIIGTFIVLTALAAGSRAQSTGEDPAAPAAPKIEVVETEAIHAVVLPMKGSYTQHPQAFERLGSFLAGQGVTPKAPPFARYFSDPSVGEANLEWEVGFPVPAEVTAETPFEVKDIPATLAAVRVHRGGYETLGPAWTELVEWTMANGYQPTGPAFQSFGGDPTAPVIEMRMPVQK
jgi:effector-binding domain-containing protein